VPSPYGPILLVSNPTAGRGRGAVLPRLVAALKGRGLDNAVAVTQGPGDATRIAREAVTEHGIRFVVAVGGDGTVHEVVNGLLDAESGRPVAEDVVFGAVAGGSGCDFIRTFGLDRSPERSAVHLDGDTVMPIDVGRVRVTAADGTTVTRLFANIAEAGYGGLVTAKANGYPRWLGKSRYVLAVLGAVREFRLVDTSVTIDHTQVSEPMSNVIVANCQFFGGNMKVAPRALPDDGRFNVQVWRGSAADVFKQTPKLRMGEHLTSPDVREYQSARVEISSASPLIVEADGEVLGTTPATFDIVERALKLKI
jgi:diacylglycerol kinase (ATP)